MITTEEYLQFAKGMKRRSNNRMERQMDQVKVGSFIAQIRKEEGMTQKELAGAIGVSDKTISKWECGNGMPELSMLIPLCELLKINVNELLSGERLSHDNYSRKAEENIMSLMQEKEENKKQYKRNGWSTVFMFILTVLTVYAVIGYTLFLSLGASVQEGYGYLYQFPDAVLILTASVLTLTAVRLWKPFFRAFGIFFGHKEYSLCQVEESVIALRLVGNVSMVTGILISILATIIIFWNVNIRLYGELEAYVIAFGIALVGFVYGLAVKLLTLPLQSRLEVIAVRLKEMELVK